MVGVTRSCTKSKYSSKLSHIMVLITCGHRIVGASVAASAAGVPLAHHKSRRHHESQKAKAGGQGSPERLQS